MKGKLITLSKCLRALKLRNLTTLNTVLLASYKLEQIEISPMQNERVNGRFILNLWNLVYTFLGQSNLLTLLIYKSMHWIGIQ